MNEPCHHGNCQRGHKRGSAHGNNQDAPGTAQLRGVVFGARTQRRLKFRNELAQQDSGADGGEMLAEQQIGNVAHNKRYAYAEGNAHWTPCASVLLDDSFVALCSGRGASSAPFISCL